MRSILGISGSPRRGGVTDTLLDKILAGAASKGGRSEKIVLNGISMRPCQECGGCDRTGVCVIRDDMTPIYHKISAADAIVVASPIFFGSVSAQLKGMIDRCQAFWVAKYVLKKSLPDRSTRKGIFISAAGEDKAQYFENAKEIVKHFFATVSVSYDGEIFLGGCSDSLGCGIRSEDAKKVAFQMGEKLFP